MTEVAVGHPAAKPILDVPNFGIQIVEQSEPVVRNGVNRHPSILLAPGAFDEPPIDELVDQTSDVRRRIQHPFGDLTAGMPVRMDAAENAKDVVVAKLEPKFGTGGLHTSSYVGGSHEKVQHRLLRAIFERSRLLDAIAKNLSHNSMCRFGKTHVVTHK